MSLLSDDYDASNSVVPGGGADSILMQTDQSQLSVKSGVVENGKPSYPPPFSPLQGMPIRPFTPTTYDGAQITQSMRKQAPSISIKRSSQAELPFARKASLARFLVKRKDRILEALKRDEGASACDDCNDAELLGIPFKKIKL